MLVLSRKVGEVITIGNGITVTVLSVDRGTVRIGVDAPRDVRVHRKEVFDRIRTSNESAARVPRASVRGAVARLRAGDVHTNGHAYEPDATEPTPRSGD
jgi:carbon storage regulator